MGQLVFQATLGGAVNLVGPNTASTFNLNVPAVSSTIATLAAQTFAGTQTFSVDAVVNGLTVGRGASAIATNTAVGASAMNGTSYSNSTAVGYQALYTGGGGTETAIGSQALYTSGGSAGFNTAVGYRSLYLNSSGLNNVAMGVQALNSNTTASNSTAVGYQAGYSNTAANNTFLGWSSGYFNSTGVSNVAVGSQAYAQSGSLATGSYNVAIGQSALQANQTSSYSTAVGYQAGYSAISADYNTFIGYYAGRSTTGDQNTFLGKFAGNAVTTGATNTIVGAYNGNQGGLDIRTASNYTVISDGGGTPHLAAYANGTVALQGAVPVAGTGITFPATQSASSNANTLDDYDEYTAASTACTGALIVSVAWKLTKVGKIVTLTLPPTYGTCVSAGSSWTYGVLLPSKYRPANEITLPVGLKDNGSVVTGIMGMIYITTGGEIRVYKSFNGTDTFTIATTIGIAQNASTSISWII